MKGNKFLAAVLAASMVFSAAPVTAMNVFASTTVTSPTEDPTGLPKTSEIVSGTDLSALTANKTSTDIAGLTTSGVSTALGKDIAVLASSYAGLALDGDVTEVTTDKKTASDADEFAYRTFKFKLTSTANATGQEYTVKLAADTLTDDEAVAVLSDSIDTAIQSKFPITVDTNTNVKAAVDGYVTTALSTFKSKFTNNASSVKVDSQTISTDSSTYSFTVHSGSKSKTVTRTLNYYPDSHVSVEATTMGTEAGIAAVKSAVISMNAKPGDANSDGAYSPAEIKTFTDAIKASSLKNYQIENVSVTDENNFSFDAADATGTYRVTIGVNLGKDYKAVKDALDKFFDKTTFELSKDGTLRNMDIANKAAADSDVASALSAAHAGSTITGSSAALGSDNAVTIKVTINSQTYVYTNTATVERSDKTKEEANSEALKEINAKTYPDYHLEAETGNTKKDGTGDAVKHDADWLKNEITADLKAAGYDVDSLDATWTPSAKKATATANGSYKVVINSTDKDVVNIALTYSSDQKSKDTNDSLLKVIKKGSTAGTDGADDKRVTDHAASEDAVKNNTATDVDGSKVYTFDEDSSLSKAIQAKDAVKATSTADAVKVVEDKINEQLKKDGVDTNGVKVSVKAVNVQAGKDGKIDAGQSDAAADKTGTVTLLVTTSIKNDFYGSQDKLRNVENNYVLVIDTNQLKPNAVKSITLKDKSVLLTNDYYTKASRLDEYGYEADQNNSTKCTFVEITPEIDPEDANSEIDYKVYNAKKEDVTAEVKKDVYKKGASSKVSVAANSLGLAITEAGTYTITATADDAEATMTLTVRKNFTDVPATAYYANAVVWAYANGVTAGTSEDTFGTNDPVTRAQYVTWLYKYAVSQDSSVAIADDDVKSVFSDVATTAFYAKAVQWAKENGITAGTTATTFSPDQAITRAQAIQMLWVAKGRPYAGLGQENEETLKFTDVPDNAFYKTAVRWAVQYDVTAGTSATTFGPDDICRRCQAVQFIYLGKDVNR